MQAHQLPPTLQVTMVAIEEENAKRMENGGTPPAQITAALTDNGRSLFSGSVSDPLNGYAQDLDKLETNLKKQRIHYRVFTSTVALRESRWSP